MRWRGLDVSDVGDALRCSHLDVQVDDRPIDAVVCPWSAGVAVQASFGASPRQEAGQRSR